MRTCLIAVVAAFGLISPAVRADIGPPVPLPRDVKFTVEVDEKADGPKLVVPQNLTTVRFRPRPAPGGAPGKEPVAFLEEDVADEAAPRNPNHLMVAGVAVTLALGLGGVWLVRRPGRNATRGLVLLLAAGGTLTAGTIAWANAPAPPLPPAPVALPTAFDGKVKLEVTRGGDTIRLVLDKGSYEKLKK